MGEWANGRGNVDGRAKNWARLGRGSLASLSAPVLSRGMRMVSAKARPKETLFRFVTISKTAGHAPRLKTGADTR
jgi:hypothetical protein